jgi:N-acetylglucosamine kinase-like BadF-type ATPase
VGFDAAKANIATAVAAAFHDAGIPASSVASACLGLAGAGRLSEQRMIYDWAIEVGIATSVRVTHDAEIILAAGCPGGTGIALICGTGSLAWGRNTSGETARAGGWGYLLGDEGSGYAIALEGLRAVVRAADGRGAESALRDSFLNVLDARSPADLVEKIYDPQLTRRQLADLSRVVFDAAGVDETARGIVQRAAAELAALVTTLAARLALPNHGFDLVCAGGVIVHQPLLQAELAECLSIDGIAPRRCQHVVEPVSGAVALARQ